MSREDTNKVQDVFGGICLAIFLLVLIFSPTLWGG